ncbi:MAG: hypothetical protein HZB24_04225 [Desulfobacterales bacterium]|nr:hypothetical protein [Desulfobacterales bacterium]
MSLVPRQSMNDLRVSILAQRAGHFCSGMGCEIVSMGACLASRPKMYLYQGNVYCERHYLEAAHANQPNPSELIWDFERGYSGMFPQANNAEAAFHLAQR